MWLALTGLVALLSLSLRAAEGVAERLDEPGLRGLRALSSGRSAVHGERPRTAIGRLEEALEWLDRGGGPLDWRAIAQVELGATLGFSGRVLEAESAVEEAMAALQELGTVSPEALVVLDHCSALERVRSRYSESLALENRALDLRRRFGIGGEALAVNLEGLARSHGMSGDYERAETLLREAISMRQRELPRTEALPSTMHRLAVLLVTRGELDRARDVVREGLSIALSIDPDSDTTGRLVLMWGTIARLNGEFDVAEEYSRRGWSIRRKSQRGPLTRISELTELGRIQYERGDLASAEATYLQVLEMLEVALPNGRRVNRILFRLGRVARARGEYEKAETYLRRAFEGLDGRDYSRPRIYFELAESLRSMGRLEEAEQWFDDLLDEAEGALGRLGGSLGVQEDFRAERAVYYESAMELKLEMGAPEEAFLAQERARARTLLTLLADRRQGIPESDLQLRYQELARRYDRVLRTIREEGPEEDLLRRRRFLEQSRRQVAERMRRSGSSRVEEVVRPRGYGEVSRYLPPGTVGLYYATTGNDTWLFILERGRPLEVLALGVREEELESRVDAIIALSRATGVASRVSEARGAGLENLSRELFSRLVAPASHRLASAREIVVFPDGPLHRLPFGLLRRDAPGAEGAAAAVDEGRYLIEWRPLHVALSATLYAELGERRRERRTPSLAAFGVSDGTAVRDPEGRSLDPLPHSRTEVEGISQFYRDATIYLDGAASEEAGRSDAVRRASVIHFAGHTVLDPDFPLDSGLVFIDESGGSELLQAWEIMEQLDLTADLVVLSSCSSALGGARGGDGLVGLTSAFQSIGARAVVASLWGVPDRTTAELMTRFHRYLAGGRGQADALRRAQLDLIRGRVEGDFGIASIVAEAPYHWAAFQLYGMPR